MAKGSRSRTRLYVSDKMRKSALLLAVASLAALPSGAAPRPTQAAVADQDLVAALPAWDKVAPLVILHNQYNNSGGVALNSQEYELSYAGYDCTAADDFVVPANTHWTVKGVAVRGTYFNGPGPTSSFNVYFYQDDGPGGLPGTLRVTRKFMKYIVNGVDEFRVVINPPVHIPGGPSGRHVWMSVQARMDYAEGAIGQWGWYDRVVVSNMPAAWQNANGEFGVCPNWDVLDSCFGGLNDGDDLVYLLVGTSTT